MNTENVSDDDNDEHSVNENDESEDEHPLVDYNSPDWHPLPASDTERMALAQTVEQRSQFYAGDWSNLAVSYYYENNNNDTIHVY
jgi:hypothetical protein